MFRISENLPCELHHSVATLIILEALSWTFRWSPCFYLISVLLFFFIPWSFAFHCVEKGPAIACQKVGTWKRQELSLQSIMWVELENLKVKMKLIGRRAEISVSHINCPVLVIVASLFESECAPQSRLWCPLECCRSSAFKSGLHRFTEQLNWRNC